MNSKLIFTVFFLFFTSNLAHAGVYYSNDEFGIKMDIPRNVALCPLSYGEHDHGILVVLPPSEGWCTNPQSSRYISIFAEYNSAFMEDESNLIMSLCPKNYKKIKYSPAPSLNIYSCDEAKEKDWVNIIAIKQQGAWPGPHSAPEDETPYMNYTFELHTKNAFYEDDMSVFVKILNNIIIN